MKTEYSQEDLIYFDAFKESIVAIDSDGCVFGTMDIKQKEHFHPLIIEIWGLERIESQLREVAEFINLYSAYRGQNRFIALLLTFQLLRQRADVAASGVRLPSTASLQAYCDSGLPLGNPSLEAEVGRTGDYELSRILEWSLAVNESIDQRMAPVKPFEWARKALDMISESSDAIVVSQTPEEALVKEWNQHGLSDYVSVIAGQELGTKAEHLALVMKDRYQCDQVLMIGDAPGDMRAAQKVGACFYPIRPRHEEESWRRLCESEYQLFLDGEFDSEHQEELCEEYSSELPTTPPWNDGAD